MDSEGEEEGSCISQTRLAREREDIMKSRISPQTSFPNTRRYPTSAANPTSSKKDANMNDLLALMSKISNAQAEMNLKIDHLLAKVVKIENSLPQVSGSGVTSATAPLHINPGK